MPEQWQRGDSAHGLGQPAHPGSYCAGDLCGLFSESEQETESVRTLLGALCVQSLEWLSLAELPLPAVLVLSWVGTGALVTLGQPRRQLWDSGLWICPAGPTPLPGGQLSPPATIEFLDVAFTLSPNSYVDEGAPVGTYV